MKQMGLNELRQSFLDFFESKGHTRLDSAPLVPKDEASLLLINSGMAPLKKYFLGVEHLPGGSKRATSCQKCIRTPDIDNVGKTARHGTFFEMLGNFSFGDYFKTEATQWAWEFFTKVLEIPADLLYVSVFHEDDEAYKIWSEKNGVDKSHIVKLGKEDNFWEIGSGPCGPCSEIYFDRGEKYGCNSPTCAPGCDCDRYVEVWNLVFTQFNSDGKGSYTPLENPNIDTGMGLERLACVMQDVDNLFEVDTVRRIMDSVCKTAGVRYKDNEKSDISIRIIVDHIRSTTFLVGDGVIPQNEGRGYVLRRLLRRAARHGRLLGIDRPFLHDIALSVIEENRTAYPELLENKGYITKVIKTEEERFARTIDQGLALLDELVANLLKSKGERVLSGDDAFKLYDTYGFPLDLTIELAQEKGISVDTDGFEKNMELQRSTARQATKRALGDAGWTADALADLDISSTFVGYSQLNVSSSIQAILCDNTQTEQIIKGVEGVVVLSVTPFYAEGGGQVGDTGTIKTDTGIFKVTDCKKIASGAYLAFGECVEGNISVGQGCTAQVDEERRAAIVRNHSAIHLLQSALRSVLGEHVHQAGSYVDENIGRFDFSHFSAVTAEEIQQIEDRVNAMIFSASPVEAMEMPIEKAKELGAIALFGEKYGDTVRVIDMQGCSVELCGGTHAKNTSMLGLFKVLRESSVASGVRRMEITTGTGVLKLISEQANTLDKSCEPLKLGTSTELPERVSAVVSELKTLEKKLSELEERNIDDKLGKFFENATKIGDLRFISVSLTGVKNEHLRSAVERAKQKSPNNILLLSSVIDGKGSICVGCGTNAVASGIHAGKIIQAITKVTGGNGGGRADSAMGGVADIFRIDEAIAQLPDVIRAMKK